MSQSRVMSALKSVANIAVGYGVAVSTQLLGSLCSGWRWA